MCVSPKRVKHFNITRDGEHIVLFHTRSPLFTAISWTQQCTYWMMTIHCIVTTLASHYVNNKLDNSLTDEAFMEATQEYFWAS